MKKLLTIFLLLILLMGCGSKKSDSAASTYELPAMTQEMVMDTAGEETSNNNISKIQITSYLSFETKDLDATSNKVLEVIKEFNGVIINTNVSTYGENNQYRDSSLEVRIPVDEYESFIEKIEGVATLTNYSTSKNDVTKSYIDTDTRIKTLETEEERLNELLKKAETVSDIVVIEDKLSEVRSNIESLKSQRDYLDTITDNATITININQVTEYTSNVSFIDRIGYALTNSFTNFVNVLEDVVIFVVYAIPFILVIGIIVFVIIKIRSKKNGK